MRVSSQWVAWREEHFTQTSPQNNPSKSLHQAHLSPLLFTTRAQLRASHSLSTLTLTWLYLQWTSNLMVWRKADDWGMRGFSATQVRACWLKDRCKVSVSRDDVCCWSTFGFWVCLSLTLDEERNESVFKFRLAWSCCSLNLNLNQGWLMVWEDRSVLEALN